MLSPQASDGQSRIARLPRVGGLASIPSRAEGLALVLDDILGQLDPLYVYLDGYGATPACVRHPKVVVLRSQSVGVWWSSGKFLGVNREELDCIYITFDDDIRYAPDHVSTLVAGLGRYGGRALVGFHGSLFHTPCRHYSDRLILPFTHGLSRDVEVDTLGSATTAFLPARLPIHLRSWPYLDIDDLMLSLAAERSGMPRIALARPPGFARAIALGQPDSLSVRVAHDDRRHVRYVNELLELERRSPRGLPPRPGAPRPTAPRRPSPPASRLP